ncbi:MAG TPA: DUF4142 domain-containing protein [Pyrinomonadaceae bacterium]
MRKLLLVVIVFTVISFGCTPADTTTNTNTNSNTNSTAAASPVATPARSQPQQDDNTFAMDVAQNNMAEIALAKLAAQKSKNADVKKFAQRLVTDHTKAGQELKKIAATKNITLPTDVKPEQKQTHDRFMSLSGADFDREFMSLMAENHDKSVTSFQGEANNGSDAELKDFATKTLPTLQEHQRMAHDIYDKLG